MKQGLMFMLVVVLLLLAACGEDDNDENAAGNGGNEILNVETLRERASELDGETVTVRSNYWSNEDGQYLSDIMMESYPPQIPFDQAVILDGEVPEPVLDMLTSAEPSFAQVTWGEVEVTGVVSVDGDEVHLEITEIGAVQA
jgi:hypothetical protein